VWQAKSEEVDLALYATDDADGFTKVCLGVPRRMHQRHEHLLSPLRRDHRLPRCAAGLSGYRAVPA
jgi:hypothetical protein